MTVPDFEVASHSERAAKVAHDQSNILWNIHEDFP